MRSRAGFSNQVQWAWARRRLERDSLQVLEWGRRRLEQPVVAMAVWRGRRVLHRRRVSASRKPCT